MRKVIKKSFVLAIAFSVLSIELFATDIFATTTGEIKRTVP